MKGKKGEKSKFLEDLTGKKFNRLLILDWLGKGTWLCLCDCGNETKVKSGHLNSGHTKSCGCFGAESRKATKNVKHGFWASNFSKGKAKFYKMWQSLRARCDNPNLKAYKNYGGRGISYDPRWEDFENFKKDMYFDYLRAKRIKKIKNVSIERKNVNGNYCKENCCFIEFTDQLKNTRSVREFIAVSPNGVEYREKNVNEFCKKYNLNSTSVYECLKGNFKQHKGWVFKSLRKITVKRGVVIGN